MHARVYGGPKWTVSPVYEGMLKEEMDAAAERHPDVPYNPQLIDAAYAGLIGGAADSPLVIPALNRDGDSLSELVLRLFGSVAGRRVGAAVLRRGPAHARRDDGGAARHRAGARGQGHREPDGDDPGCRRAAPLRLRAQRLRAGGASARAPSTSRCWRRPRRACATPDLGGHSTTTEFTDEVDRARAHQARDLVDPRP